MKTRIVVLGSLVTIAGMLASAQQTTSSTPHLPTTRRCGAPSANAGIAITCPAPAGMRGGVTDQQKAQPSSQVDERQKVETAKGAESREEERKAAEAQNDPNKSPWWEPRDWNYINSF